MKLLFSLLSLFIIVKSQAQIQDTLSIWKSGQLVIKKSIKPADMDSITFVRPTPIVNSNQVTICNQIWTTRNLDVSTYSDGTPVPQVADDTDWANLTTGAWCYYMNNPAANSILGLGKLYNYYAVAGVYDTASLNNPALRKKLAPEGWHVPSYEEWIILRNCLGGLSVAGGKMKQTGNTYWEVPNYATNSSGFTGLPGGVRSIGVGAFNLLDYNGLWWGSASWNNSSTNAWCGQLYHASTELGIGFIPIKQGLSVRCIKD